MYEIVSLCRPYFDPFLEGFEKMMTLRSKRRNRRSIVKNQVLTAMFTIGSSSL